MTQTLTCSDARHLIHLSVGDDTVHSEEESLASHLSSCGDCRTYHDGMSNAMHVLDSVRSGDSGEIPMDSLWPALADRIQVRQAKAVPQQEGRRFNVSVAALCACSLALAFATVIQNLPSNQPDAGNGMMMPAMNVNYGAPFTTPNQQAPLMQVQGPNGEVYVVDPSMMMAPYGPNTEAKNEPINKEQF